MGREVCVCAYVLLSYRSLSMTCWWRLDFSVQKCLCMCCSFSKLFKMSKKKLALKTLTHPRLRSYALTGMHTGLHSAARIQYVCVCLQYVSVTLRQEPLQMNSHGMWNLPDVSIQSLHTHSDLHTFTLSTLICIPTIEVLMSTWRPERRK